MACGFMIQVDEGTTGEKFFKKKWKWLFLLYIHGVRNVLFAWCFCHCECLAAVCQGGCRRCVREGDGLGRDVLGRIL